jgi:hypothetical protein
MPEGCEDSVMRRLRDEWGLVVAAFRDRGREAREIQAIASRHGQPPTLFILRSKREEAEFLESLG